jgi:hypothetical protein
MEVVLFLLLTGAVTIGSGMLLNTMFDVALNGSPKSKLTLGVVTVIIAIALLIAIV